MPARPARSPFELMVGNSIECLEELPAVSVQSAVTSLPYRALSDYGVEPVEWLEVEYSLHPGLPATRMPSPAAAPKLGRHAVGMESNPESAEMARERVLRETGVAATEMDAPAVLVAVGGVA